MSEAHPVVGGALLSGLGRLPDVEGKARAWPCAGAAVGSTGQTEALRLVESALAGTQRRTGTVREGRARHAVGLAVAADAARLIAQHS